MESFKPSSEVKSIAFSTDGFTLFLGLLSGSLVLHDMTQFDRLARLDWIVALDSKQIFNCKEQPFVKAPTEGQAAAAAQPAETQPAETQPAETQPAETQPAETQPAAAQPAETQPAETQPAKAESLLAVSLGLVWDAALTGALAEQPTVEASAASDETSTPLIPIKFSLLRPPLLGMGQPSSLILTGAAALPAFTDLNNLTQKTAKITVKNLSFATEYSSLPNVASIVVWLSFSWIAIDKRTLAETEEAPRVESMG